MLQYIQFLVFELGNKCDLTKIHPKCPIALRTESDRKLSDTRIVELADQAYNKLGFTGLIAWHFYNEPMLQWKRMIGLMEVIRYKIPQSRFLLWTNGTIMIDDPRFDMFEKVVVTNYHMRPEYTYKKYYRNHLTIGYENFDNRILYGEEFNDQPCLRPFIEFIIAYSGDVHLCCQDWKNEVKIGNVIDIDLEELVKKRHKISLSVCKKMNSNSPEVCQKCNGRIGLPLFEPEIANRTFAYLATIN